MGQGTGIRAVAVLGGLLMLLAGASGSALAQGTKVRIGGSVSPPAMDTIVLYVAREEGFFKQAGLDVQLLDFRGDATHTKAFLAGELEVMGEIGASSGIVSATKVPGFRAYYVLSQVTPYFFVARAPVAKVSELAGKSIAVSGLGAISHHIPRVILERAGVDPDQARYISLGSPADRFKALVAGKVEATLIAPTEAVLLGRYPEIRVLVRTPEALPEFPYEFSMARREWVDRNPEAMAGVVKGLIQAARFSARNKEGVVKVAVKVTRQDADLLAKSYDLFPRGHWSVNGELDRRAYQYTADLMVKVGYMKTAVPYEEFFDRRFVDRALQELGRWKE
ncbi:MAG: ABC transporter substrate-binding protein [Deltaproteobacteria bacterium]|nr:ABC transporter substrate-binding protein [Deltaproteobacteria bacterium]